jgi:hypothetical protein
MYISSVSCQIDGVEIAEIFSLSSIESGPQWIQLTHKQRKPNWVQKVTEPSGGGSS